MLSLTAKPVSDSNKLGGVVDLVGISISRVAAQALRRFAAAATAETGQKVTVTTSARLAAFLARQTQPHGNGAAFRHFDKLHRQNPDTRTRTTIKVAPIAKKELDSFAGLVQQSLGVRVTMDRAVMHACRLAGAQLSTLDQIEVAAIIATLNKSATPEDAAILDELSEQK